MALYILHLLFVLLSFVIATEGAANNTLLLREFYRKTAYSVQTEGRRMLTNELKKEYVNDRENYLKNKMIKNINAIDSLYLTTKHDQSLCDLYEGFKLARQILDSYHELKKSLPATKTSLDDIYTNLVTQCPLLTVGSVYPGHSSYFSLLLTNENGLGQFMGRSRSPEYWCCRFEDAVDGGAHHLQFRYQGDPKETKEVRYSDVVAIWTQGKYLYNKGPALEWYAWEWSDRVRWSIEPFCKFQANNQQISQCDLVTFNTHLSHERGYYLIYGTTSRVQRDGVFAVLNQEGKIPESLQTDKVDGGDQYRLQFRFEHGSNAKALRYADVVGIWTQGKYLINSGEKLSWAEWEWNDKIRWTVKPSCQAHLDNQVVDQCDLVSFITHHPDQRGRHLINSDTSERPTSGLFAILNANGQIPV